MAKAASQNKMNYLHDKIADIFLMVLRRYEAKMAVVDNQIMSGALEHMDELEAELIKELCEDGGLPSPAMMTAITKFLKDNEIMFEKDKIEELSETRKALEEKARSRPKLSDLTIVPSIGGMQ